MKAYQQEPRNRANTLGEIFEKYCKMIFSNQKFIYHYKNKIMLNDISFFIFKLIMDKTYSFKSNKVQDISCTMNLPKTDNGGKAKTDLLIEIEEKSTINKLPTKIPISIKHTFIHKNNKRPLITLSQKKADEIINELKISDITVKNSISSFQEYGNLKNIKEDQQKKLKEFFLDDNKRRELIRFAVRGTADKDKIDDVYPQFIVIFFLDHWTYEVLNVDIYSCEEYIEKLFLSSGGTFESGLTWTYQGTRGKNIQFKGYAH
jgi:hypothetical protein